jgi:hypothetical protein
MEPDPFENLLRQLAKPAQRAILNAGITSLEQIANTPVTDFLKLHGIGQNALGKTRAVLREQGLSFSDMNDLQD